MIIQCINCNKNFEVNSSLIPDLGRNIQCGSCNHTWFYKFISKSSSLIDQDIDKEVTIKDTDIAEQGETNFDQKVNDDNDIIINKHDLPKKTKAVKLLKIKSSSNLSLNKFFSYFLVAIISSVALIIILETLKSPLSNLFPGLELVLYNLFETIIDISLFFKNLLF